MNIQTCTPVPKIHPPQSTSDVRNISGLLTFDKVMEKLLSQLILADMKPFMDPTQYGNERGLSIDHYLVNIVQRILSVLDNSHRGDKTAVILNLIDWNNAFPRQNPKLGVESFIKNGVRPALIPLLTNYFQDRKMKVKWHGCQSVERSINGGCPAGATLGLLQFLSPVSYTHLTLPTNREV